MSNEAKASEFEPRTTPSTNRSRPESWPLTPALGTSPPGLLSAPDARDAPDATGVRSQPANPPAVAPPPDGRAITARMGYLALDQLGNGCLVQHHTSRNPTVYLLTSSQFAGLLQEELRRAGKRLNARELRAFIEELKAEAAYRGQPVVVSRRVARAANGDVVIALHDDQNTHIRISPNQVLVMTRDSQELFYRSPFASPLAMPAEVGDAQLLKRYINLRDESFVLYLAWVSYTLAHGKVNGTTFPLLVLVGGQGTGKSHLSKVTIAIVDPSAKGVERLPSNPHDLALAAQSGHVLVFDNLRHLTAQQSDSLCIVATGGAATTRKLYTDDEQKVIQLHAAVVLNSIVGVVDQPDLAQRSLSIRLDPMPESARRSDTDLFREFEADLPKIMRGLFDLIAKILAALPTAVVVKPQRMIDFVRWLAAMEKAQGIPDGLGPYQEAYAQVINEGQRDSLQDNVVGAAILDFAEVLDSRDPQWVGTPAELYARLSDAMIHARFRLPRDWPDNAIALSKRLLALQAALMTQGIELTFKRGKTRTITVRKLGGA